MNWQQWIVWAIFAVAVIFVWRWIWRAFFCRSRGCEQCHYGYCGMRDKAWEEEYDKRNAK